MYFMIKDFVVKIYVQGNLYKIISLIKSYKSQNRTKK